MSKTAVDVGRQHSTASLPARKAFEYAAFHVCVFLQIGWTVVTVGSSLAVALLVPDQAEKIYAVVGATAVCCVCYVVPVFIQLHMYQQSRKQHKAAMVSAMHTSLSLQHQQHVMMARQCMWRSAALSCSRMWCQFRILLQRSVQRAMSWSLGLGTSVTDGTGCVIWLGCAQLEPSACSAARQVDRPLVSLPVYVLCCRAVMMKHLCCRH